MYYLIIDTDGDFELKIKGQEFHQEEIRIKAKTFNSLKKAIDEAEIIDNNPSNPTIGHEFLQKLRKSMKRKKADVSGGNWYYEYGPVSRPEWDMEIG
jgi:hypothetical protein